MLHRPDNVPDVGFHVLWSRGEFRGWTSCCTEKRRIISRLEFTLHGQQDNLLLLQTLRWWYMGKSKNPEFGIHATWTIYRRILRWTTRSVDFTLFRPEDNPEASIYTYTYTYTYSSAAFLLLIKVFGIPNKSRCRAWVAITRALLNMWN